MGPMDCWYSPPAGILIWHRWAGVRQHARSCSTVGAAQGATSKTDIVRVNLGVRRGGNREILEELILTVRLAVWCRR